MEVKTAYALDQVLPAVRDLVGGLGGGREVGCGEVEQQGAVQGGAGDVAVADQEAGPGPAVGDQAVQRRRARA